MEVVSSVRESHHPIPDWEVLTDALVLSFMEVDDHRAVAKLLTLAETHDKPWNSLDLIYQGCLANLAGDPQDPILRRAAALLERALDERARMSPLTSTG